MKQADIQLFGAIEDIKKEIQKLKITKLDTARLESLTAKLAKNTSVSTEQISILSETIDIARKPVVSQRKIVIEIASKEVFFTIVGLLFLLLITISFAIKYKEDNRELREVIYTERQQ